MKQLVCEMCNSNDLVKQDGLFVCQHCGTKYSVEEARKMMVEGTIDVSGSTIKIDASSELDNLYQLARRAKDTNNIENAAKYYEMILLKDPTSWEANFYAIYYKSVSCTIARIGTSAKNVYECIESTYILIRDTLSDVNEKKKAIVEVVEHALHISDHFRVALNNYVDTLDPNSKAQYRVDYHMTLLSIDTIKPLACRKLCEIFYEDEALLSTVILNVLKYAAEDPYLFMPDECVQVIRTYDPTYELRETILRPSKYSTPTVASGLANVTRNGCYVATAVYGSYDCPQVWTLRRFRDETLAATWYGRAFIHTYYAISPTLVKWFGHTEWFKSMWKGKLDRMVAKLNMSGVEDTPYEDRAW